VIDDPSREASPSAPHRTDEDRRLEAQLREWQEQFGPMLLALCRHLELQRHQAERIVEETWIIALALHQEWGAVHDPGEWLAGIARRLCPGTAPPASPAPRDANEERRREEQLCQWQEQFGPMLLGLCLHLRVPLHHAEEIVQETWIRAWGCRREWGDLRHPKAWLKRIAQRLCLNWRDRQILEWRTWRPLGDKEDHPDQQPGPDEDCSSRELADRLRGLLRKLPRVERDVIEMRDGREMTFAEIAQALKSSPRTVGRIYKRARGCLKKLLEPPPPSPK
jgi:RNA polymerase sigma-70 factor (ECF subfamily)